MSPNPLRQSQISLYLNDLPSSWVIGWGKRTAMPSPPIKCLSLPKKCVVLLTNLTWMLSVPMTGHPESQVLQYLASEDLSLLPSSQSYTWDWYSAFGSFVISYKEATNEAQKFCAVLQLEKILGSCGTTDKELPASPDEPVQPTPPDEPALIPLLFICSFILPRESPTSSQFSLCTLFSMPQSETPMQKCCEHNSMFIISLSKA